MAQLNFNANMVKPQQSFDALPPGKYEAIITESEMKATKSGSGEYLQLTFEVVNNDEFSGRKLWARLNLVNDNKTAVEIAERELSAICHCVGVLSPQDSEELHDRPLVIDVAQEMGPNGNNTNRIKGYRAAGERKEQKAEKKPVAAVKAAKPWGQ
jgi:hypothetical protein